jgi:hypothetical protein
MGSTRKLVLENENSRINFVIISRFLKEMGWWQYWKEYVETGAFRRYQTRFNNGNWFEPTGGIYSVFALSSFSSYLIKFHNAHVFTVLDLFVVFANMLYYDELKTESWNFHPEPWAINYLKRKGLYEKWELEKELKKSKESESQSLEKSPSTLTHSTDSTVVTLSSPSV